ncbi:MAG: hypothetical protein AAGA37_14480 [Actinomycetota bacterium]
MQTTETTEESSSSSTKIVALVAAVAVVVIGAVVVFGGGGDDDAPAGDATGVGGELVADESTSSEVASEPAADETTGSASTVDDTDATVEETVEDTDATVEEGAEEEAAADDSSRPEVPTVVIGQDEEGNDIVVELEVAGGCAQTFHEPLDENSFSFIRWTYDAPGLEPGLAVRVSNGDGFEFFTVVTPDYKVVVEQGITSYGDYPFPDLEWNVEEGSVSIAPLQNHTVDEREGEASESCLEEV